MQIKKVFVFAGLLLTNASLNSMELACKSNNYPTNNSILNRSPDYFWDESKPKFHWGMDEPKGGRKTLGNYIAKGSASVMPYYIQDKIPYVLLSRETWGENKGKYCDLGGAVEVSGGIGQVPRVSTFLETLISEGTEESGNMYHFDKEDILKNASVLSYRHTEEGFYKDFESVLAWHQVPVAYTTEEFLKGAREEIKKRQVLNLCTWCYQEKDDYQWIKWNKMLKFLVDSREEGKSFRTLDGEKAEIIFRPYYLKMLRDPLVLGQLENIKLK